MRPECVCPIECEDQGIALSPTSATIASHRLAMQVCAPPTEARETIVKVAAPLKTVTLDNLPRPPGRYRSHIQLNILRC